jgi:hypothetical protein
MRVFISWSGEPSGSIARALTPWLEKVVQHADVWMSEDIASGARWNEAVAKSLDETDFGICCLTRDNQHAPWLVFEAGALAKRVEKGRVVPLYIDPDLEASEVTGPLAAFQGRQLDESGVRRLVQDISAASEKPMSPQRINEIFDLLWPALEAEIGDAINRAPVIDTPKRATEDMLAELVDRVRAVERAVGQGPSDFSLDAMKAWLVAPPSPSDEAAANAIISHAGSMERLAVAKRMQGTAHRAGE